MHRIALVTVGLFLSFTGCQDIAVKYDSGAVMCKGKLINKQKEGYWAFLYENGDTCMSGKYEQGRRTGLWRFCNSEGSPSYAAEYVRDTMNGEIMFFDTVQRTRVFGHMLDNKMLGQWYNIRGGDTIPAGYHFGDRFALLPKINCPCNTGE